MKTILNIHQIMMNSHSKVYQGYSKGIRFVATLLAVFCMSIGNAWGTDYELVTSASSLASGDHIIIVNGDDDYAISTTQNTNNRAATSVTMSSNIITPGDAVQVLTLGVGTTESSYWTLSPSSGNYLYAASSSKNYLRTQSTIDVNAEWEITIDANGDATVIASGSSNRNEMNYNANNGSPIFSCYSSGGTLHIYKEAASNFTVSFGVNTAGYGTVSPTSIANVPSGTAITKGTGANVNKITINGTTVTATPASQDENYNYTFSSWNVPGNVTTVTSALTITANFTRTARPMTNYRTVCDASAPTLTVDPSSLTGMGYKYGESPTAKSFSMSGANLTSGTLTVTAPTNYEVCKTSGGTYASSITFTGVSGTLSATTVYVRLKSGKSVGDYNDEKVSINGCGLAAAVKVNCSGTVYYEDIYKTGLHTSIYSTYASGVSKTGTYTVPSLPDVSKSVECEGLHYHFAGWVTDTYKASPEGHFDEATGSKTADNTTYWAVWVQEAGAISYSKVTSTSAVVDGVYVIVNDGKYLPNASTGSSGTPAYGDTYSVTLNGDGSQITSAVTDGMKWYFTMSDGKATIRNAASDGEYLYQTNDNNGMRIYTTSDTWTVEENSTGFALKGTTRSRYCAGAPTYNNWRSYTTKDQGNYADGGIIYLYKENIEYEDPVTECPELTCGTPTTPTSTPSTYSATLGWTEASPGTKARYEYIAWPKGTDEPTSGYSTSETTSGSVSGLLSNTEYRWKVRKVCTGTDGESGWLKSSFTTTGATVTFVVPEGVSAVSSQSTTSAMPSAGVPSSESKCWAFLGWTTAAYSDYSGGSAPAKLFPNGTYAHLTPSDGTTLYAVYGQTEYELIWETDELEDNDNYVLTFEDNSDKIWALSNEDYSTYDAAITEVTSKAREDAYGFYLYNIGANNVWKFTGTSSSGQLYNAAADKYLNLSSTTAKILNTTNNLTFTVDGGYWNINSTNYLLPNPSTSYTVAASIEADEYSALIYHETNALYTTSPDWTEHTIAWKKEGVTYSTGTPSTSATACAGIATMPTAPSTSLPCADTFVGWSEKELVGTGNTAPNDLFRTVGGAPKIDEDKTFNAVFATAIGTAIAAVEDNSFTSKDENGGYGNSTFSFKSTGKYLQKQSIWNSTNMTNVKVRIRVYHYSNNTADVLRVSLINSSGTEVVGADLNTTRFGTNMNTVGGYSDYVELTPTTAVTGYKVSLKTLNSYGVGINKIEREVVPSSYKDYITGCPNVYTNNNGSGNGQWDTGTNWSRGAVPNLAQPVFIEKPVTVNTTAAQAYSIVIDQSSSKTGSIEISAGQELVVAKTIQKKDASGDLIATGENDIVIYSNEDDGLGALVMGDYNGTNKATVNFYTKSNGKKQTNTSVAQYVGTPFNDETNILYNWYNSWIYKLVYDESGNIDWERVNEGDGMEPFKGYCVFSADAWNNAEGHTYWMQGTLVSSANHTCSGLNWQSDEGADNLNNENMLANSWMAPIKISAMQTSDFHNADATIYIFNSTSSSAYEDLDGNYDTYTVGTSTDVIPAMQSFSVFTTNSGASVTLDYNKIVYAPAVAGSAAPIPNYAPRRAGASEDEADKMRLFVRTEDGYGDMLYMWEREDFAEGFENGWDGRKLYGESYAPQLYAITPDGEMAVNCVPDWEGTVLGFRKGTEDNVYTFTFEYDGENTWYLNDLKEQTSTLISAESTYMFMASAEDMAARFIISRTPIHSTPTGIEQSAISGQQSAVKKIVIDDKVFIIRNGQMYHVTGVMVR